MSYTPRRGKPYVWASHISGLVSGDKQCLWAAWFKAHYRYDKRTDDGAEASLAKWSADHAALVRQKADALRLDGWEVRVEDQNAFAYRGELAVVGAKPDIVATRSDAPLRSFLLEGMAVPTGAAGEARALVVDCKTGKERASDVAQVAIYMLLGPADLSALKERAVAGEVAYAGRSLPVPRDVMLGLKPRIVSVVRQAASPHEPPKAPSAGECRYCDILDCDTRVDAVDETAGPAVEGAMF